MSDVEKKKIPDTAEQLLAGWSDEELGQLVRWCNRAFREDECLHLLMLTHACVALIASTDNMNAAYYKTVIEAVSSSRGEHGDWQIIVRRYGRVRRAWDAVLTALDVSYTRSRIWLGLTREATLEEMTAPGARLTSFGFSVREPFKAIREARGKAND